MCSIVSLVTGTSWGTVGTVGVALIGVAGSQRGIYVTTPTRFNISIYNGTVRDWGGDGVAAFYAANSQLRNLRAYDNGGIGIRIGVGGTITACTVRDNSFGIVASRGSTITGCTATGNNSNGINTGNFSTISGCTAEGNGGAGIGIAKDSVITIDIPDYGPGCIGLTVSLELDRD